MELTEYGPLAQSKALASDQKERKLGIAMLMLIGLFVGFAVYMEKQQQLSKKTMVE
jgi:hypothetical protein